MCIRGGGSKAARIGCGARQTAQTLRATEQHITLRSQQGSQVLGAGCGRWHAANQRRYGEGRACGSPRRIARPALPLPAARVRAAAARPRVTRICVCLRLTPMRSRGQRLEWASRAHPSAERRHNRSRSSCTAARVHIALSGPAARVWAQLGSGCLSHVCTAPGPRPTVSFYAGMCTCCAMDVAAALSACAGGVRCSRARAWCDRADKPPHAWRHTWVMCNVPCIARRTASAELRRGLDSPRRRIAHARMPRRPRHSSGYGQTSPFETNRACVEACARMQRLRHAVNGCRLATVMHS